MCVLVRKTTPALICLALIAASCSGTGSSVTARHRSSSSSRRRTTVRHRIAVSEVTRLPQAVQGAAVASDGRDVYVAGGLAVGDRSVSSVERISGTRVEHEGSLPVPVHDAAATTDRNGIVVFGGGNLATTEEISKVPFSGGPGHAVGRLPAPLSDLTAVVDGPSTYLIGGYTGTAYSDQILRFSGGRVETVARLPQGLRYAAAAKVGRYVLIAGGLAENGATSSILRFDPRTGQVSRIGSLPYPVAHASAGALGSRMYVIGGRRDDRDTTDAVMAIGASGTVRTVAHLPHALSDAGVVALHGELMVVGGSDGNAPLAGVSSVHRIAVKAARSSSPSPLGSQGDPGSASTRGFDGALPGDLMIADRGNDRILIVDPSHNILWRFPKRHGRVKLHFDDDTFFADGGKSIISNEEQNHDIIRIAYPSGKLLWRFGHQGVKGSRSGYLDTPDDAYRLDNGLVLVADAYNCRVLEIRGQRVVRSIGRAGHCVHDPPRFLQPVNGDTPLPNGHILVSELNTPYIDEFTLKGHLVRTYEPPVSYPSDPQPTRAGNIILADYTSPGGVVILSKKTGHVIWKYRVASGYGELNHPSLAAMLPNGNVIVGDDYNHRIVVIDPKTKEIIWHYGHDHAPGRAAGYLHTPDGFDFIPVTPSGKPNPGAIQHGP